MVNLRYHIVSLVAVFLALAIGITVGTTVGDQTVITTLRRNQVAQRNQLLQERAQHDLTRRRLGAWEGFGESALAARIRDRLAGRHVLLVLDAAARGGLVDDLADALIAAGAAEAGRLRFTDRWRLADQRARDALATWLGVASGDGDDLRRRAAEKVASALRVERDAEPLRALADAGFAALHDVGERSLSPATLIVVVWAGPEEPVPPEGSFMLPMLRALARVALVAEAEPVAAEEPLAEDVRGDADLRARIATVDHVDTSLGRFALVAALADLAAGLEPAHYGVRGRAQAVAPAA